MVYPLPIYLILQGEEGTQGIESHLETVTTLFQTHIHPLIPNFLLFIFQLSAWSIVLWLFCLLLDLFLLYILCIPIDKFLKFKIKGESIM